MSKEKKGGAKKEQLRQEKRAWKKEMKEKKEAAKAARYGSAPARPGTKKRFEKSSPESANKKFQPKTRVSKDAPAKGGKTLVLKTSRTSGVGAPVKKAPDPLMPLNKYIAHGGVCSRRDAAELVKEGKVKVNGEVVTEPGFKVPSGADVTVSGKKITPAVDLVYILLNKPKDYLTTTDDPQERKTVLDLIKQATRERVYPVGRLDRNTSGVLLLTNDGELSQKLTHPSNEIRKLYAVTLDKPLTKNHFSDILKGLQLEDGLAQIDSLAFTDPKDPTQVGIEIHSGKNRIVRRIFEHLGYKVKNLDRVLFAGLTKKNIQRGKWRFLSEKEVRDLKYFKKGKR